VTYWDFRRLLRIEALATRTHWPAFTGPDEEETL